MSRRLTADALLAHASPSVRALNLHLAACAGDDADAVLAARAEREARRAQSRAAQASGADLEHQLDGHHETAHALGIAAVEHQNPGVRVLRHLDGARFEGQWKTRSGADYVGVLRGGRAVAIEAKNAGRGRLPLVDDGSPRFDGLKQHQRDALDRCAELGGLALVAVRFRRRENRHDVETLYVAPWESVRDLVSLGPEDVWRWRVTGDCYLTPFVEGAR